MSPEVSVQNVRKIVSHNLCIGCGLCSVACQNRVSRWHGKIAEFGSRKLMKPDALIVVDVSKVCPHSPQCIAAYAAAAQVQGGRLDSRRMGHISLLTMKTYLKRIRSSSGGVTSALLERLLSSGNVDGVLASLPLKGTVGEPHFQMKIFRSVKEFDRGRSSHYHPLSYDKVLNELIEVGGSFAVVGVPCVLRGLVRLPSEVQKKIKYKICLACSHNVTGAFSDCLANKEGVQGGHLISD